ncbi:tetratricopeptide repeat protein [Desulfosediminicola flagellatus]|uniref:tetratricopeptide repeat protein n=1 Tax=Desulfosediminicola flagellatus TaxID=2569541 RepID=UPI0010ACCB39|nr:TlpA disulfide reductase family protein [Desulfosediminicola flagellatus]
MKIFKVFPNRKKLLAVIFLVTAVVLQATVSTPSLKTLGVGGKAPDFVLRDLYGVEHILTTGKERECTLLLFWATWSKNSAEALREAESFYKKYREQGLSVVGINVERSGIDEQSIKNIGAFVSRIEISFPQLIDHGLTTFQRYGVVAVPTFVIVGQDKDIVFEMSGLPLAGNENMKNYLTGVYEGKMEATVMPSAYGYKPDVKAVRFWNMGEKALQSKRNARTAENWYKKAISVDPDYIDPYLSLGRWYREHGSTAEARKVYQKVINLQPENPSALSGLAMLMIEEGNESTARELLTQAIAADEAYTPALYYLGYVHGRSGDTQKAMSLFARALELNPLDYNIYIYQGKMYEEQKQLAQAVKSYKSGLQHLLHLQ